MQEIVLILSSLAGVATAAAVRKIPRDKKQLLSLGASSYIKSQVNSLKIEKDILTKTISRLYQADSEFSKIQKDKLLLKYQHQLGIVLAKLEKLEQASNHPDLGPVGDGLITLMDQKLSRLDQRLHELSSKMPSAKVETPKSKPETKPRPFNFVKPPEPKREPVETLLPQPGAFELTTLTNISGTKSPFQPPETKPDLIPRTMPPPKPQETIQTSMSQVDTTTPKPKPDIHKALSEQVGEFDDIDDSDDLNKLKIDIRRVLDKIDQAEVE